MIREVYTKYCLNNDEPYLFKINNDFYFENGLIKYNENELNYFNEGGLIFSFENEKKNQFYDRNNQSVFIGCPVSKNHFKLIRKLLTHNSNIENKTEIISIRRKSLMEFKLIHLKFIN